MDGKIVIGTEVDTKEFDKQIDYIESRMEEIDYLLEKADLGYEVGDTQKLEVEYERLTNRLIDLKRKKQEASEQPLDDEENNIKFEKGIERITKRITRMGLAMIGIRSLYGMISSSVSRITQENPQLQAQINAIKNAVDNIVARLVNLLLPVIQFIVNLIGKLLKTLFGIDIFANNFNKSMKSANGSVTKIRKQLLGFDEMNILNKNGTTGALGDGTLNVSPPTDINMGNIKKKIQDFFDKNKININLDYVKDALEHPIEYIQTAFEHFIFPGVKKGEGLSGASGLIFGEDSLITKGIKFLHRTFLGGIPGVIENAKTIWEWLFGKGETGTVKDLKEILKSTTGMTGEMAKKIKNEFSKISVKYKDGMYEVTTKTGQVVSMTETDFKELMQALGKDADAILNSMVHTSEGIQGTFEDASTKTKTGWYGSMNSIISKALGKDQNGLIGAFTETFNEINKSSNKDSNETKKSWLDTANELIKKYADKSENGVSGSIKSAFNDLPEETKTNIQSAMKTATDLINKFKPPKKKITFGADITDAKNKVIKLLEKAGTTGLFGKVNQTLINQIRNLAKGGIINPPRLAVGGIINRPGSGVPIAVGGERGREAIVPLTDSQQMAYLGREIAKNVVINLTNVTELDGRQIARSVTQVMNDMNFASNGGVI